MNSKRIVFLQNRCIFYMLSVFVAFIYLSFPALSFAGNNILICFEGMSGAGKTTQAKLLKDRIEKETKQQAVVTEFLDKSSKIAIHKCLDELGLNNDSVVLFHIFSLGATKQYQSIQKAFKENKIVIADRWKETFHFYNDYFGPLASKQAEQRNVVVELTTGDLEPDITIVLDMDPKFAESNCLNRDRVKLEREKPTWTLMEELQKARKYYFQVGKKKKNWVVIDGTSKGTLKPIEVVHEEIWKVVSSVLPTTLNERSNKSYSANNDESSVRADDL